MRYLLLICCILKVILVSVQETNQSLNNTIWQHTAENYIYSIYHQGKLYEITDYSKSSYPEGSITIAIKIYGFYDSCELPSIDSLKQSGAYYFEVDSSDFADEATTKVNMQNNCAQMNIFIQGKDTLMNIYYSSRQQYATYRKVDALPKNIQEYLQKKGIKLDKNM
jgi:hypothetical protein